MSEISVKHNERLNEFEFIIHREGGRPVCFRLHSMDVILLIRELKRETAESCLFQEKPRPPLKLIRGGDC